MMQDFTVKDVDGRAWRTPITARPDAGLGRARLGTVHYAKGGLYHNYGVPFPDGEAPGYYRVKGRRMPVRTLEIDGKVWMVDDPPHWHGMLEHASKCKGRVVCAGLGLGLIAHALAARPEVERITVVDREADVIGLMGPTLPQDGRLEIVHGTWQEYAASGRGKDADAVVYDLFVGDGRELLPEAIRVMLELCEQFPRAAARRIHGFHSEALEMMVGGAAAAGRALRDMGGLPGLQAAIREAGGAA